MPPSVSVTAASTPVRADAVVVGVRRTKDGPRLAEGAEQIDAALGGRLHDALRSVGATGRPDEVHKIPTLGLADFPLVVATGVGDGAAPDTVHAVAPETARRAAGAALRGLTDQRRVHIALDARAGALAEGALLGAYAFTAYKSAPAKQNLRTVTIAGPTSARAEVKRAVVVAAAVAATRDLVNTPPNDLYPETFATRAKAIADEQGLAVEVLDEKALRRRGFGGVLGVGQGSARPPRLVRISYRPAKAKAHLALVGKGITFDTGGINLKTANLTWMKSDMGGAAAVVNAVAAIAALKLPVTVTATVPMAENMPSGTSYRPSDVLTMYGGRTVEVGDTDAEGRLILADAIVRAAEDSPDYLIEASTLTGAQLVSLGPRVIGAMGEPDWRDRVVAAGTAAGEAAWAMPLPEELRAGLDSPVADLVNVPGERWGGMLVAGRFLAEFVPEGLPWVHLDIAGPAYNQGGPRDYTPKGGTGAAVRTIVAAAESLAR
ncbi:leucyl aminopeptidase [Jatrophihabitans endophyticus]|uniref:Probable cytosol aminopeptidase n=1 Tax=Jatrophihabitans endophyticus TaxID=1206085 RepID=A0A1M5KYW5_9ACTN|nr:leucyl aminopeptidase [Jatrophihabitans endophyticus]SHG57957.1 leucyl aminopeptidase [Jatrophihabitans endophyticus]